MCVVHNLYYQNTHRENSQWEVSHAQNYFDSDKNLKIKKVRSLCCEL
jgi:hypothetical protein